VIVVGRFWLLMKLIFCIFLSPSHLARGAQMLDGRPTAAVNGPGAIFIGITVKKDKGWEI
jgi:hypothetical protein